MPFFIQDDTEIWSDSEMEVAETEIQNDGTFQHIGILRLYVMFMFSWQSLFKVSDVGLNVLMKFFALLFGLLVKVLSLPLTCLKPFVDKLPHGVEAARRFLGYRKDCFDKYASCPSCHSIYILENCRVTLPNKSIISASCAHKAFPNHPHRSRRNACGTVLMKSVRTSSGSTVLYPRLLYCYKSVVQSLQEFLLRPGFIELCEKWRTRNS